MDVARLAGAWCGGVAGLWKAIRLWPRRSLTNPRGNILLRQDAGVRRAHVVESRAVYAELYNCGPECLADEVQVDGQVVALGRDMAVVVESAGGHPLFELAPAVAALFSDGEGIEVDGAQADDSIEVARKILGLERLEEDVLDTGVVV